MENKNLSLTTQIVIIITILILTANAIFGFLMMNVFKTNMQTMISQRMLDISNTAAATIDGDSLKKLTAEDVGTKEYQAIQDSLSVFQENMDLEYIYCVIDKGNKDFVFGIDPTPDDPAEFGEAVVYTDALYTASLGTAATDKQPYTDKWGTFYSSYSPVFDSDGKVAGIVAVDFSTEWYDSQIRTVIVTILLSSTVSLIITGLTVFFVVSQIRRRFNQLSDELVDLSVAVNLLTTDLENAPDGTQPDAAQPDAEDHSADRPENMDNINVLGDRIRSTRGELVRYMNHLHTREKSMIAALASDYHSVYYVDLDSDEGICYRSGSMLEDSVAEGESFVYSKLFGHYAEKYVTDEYRENFLNLLRPETIRQELTNKTIISYHYLTNKNGREMYEMLRIAGVMSPDDPEDTPVRAISIGFTDVDKETRESMHRNKVLSDALAVAKESSEAKTAFLSNISHEIRTPMNAIIGLDSIALSDPDISDSTRDLLEKIGISANHLLTLINDILDMSRIESGRMVLKSEEFSFSDLIDQINTIIGEQCDDKHIEYTCSIADDIDEYFIGDDVKLKQVIINILGNAVKFTPEGGKVALNAERIKHFEKNTTLRFTMEDTGIGMDKDYLPHIFDAFSQEDASFSTNLGSTGLGMAITKRIVEMMNGDIEVESEKGVGTTFFVTLTLMDSGRVRGAAEDKEFRIQDLTVLVIESAGVNRATARMALEELGVKAEFTHSCEKALELIRLHIARREKFDIILLERNQPDTDVTEAIGEIHSVIDDNTALVISADGPVELTQEEIAAGAEGIISKPFVADDIVKEFRRVYHKKNDGYAEAAQEADINGKTVLLAEDMPINAEIIATLLGMRGVTVEIAENGKIAVDMFSSHPSGYYAAILMDMRMPEMDGLTATTVIRAMDRPDAADIPIIALTANAFDEDVQRSLQVGLSAHLSKPVEPERLYQTLGEMIWEAEHKQ